MRRRSNYDYDYYPQPSKPIKTKEGIQARSKRGEFAKNWWAERWIKALERLVDKGRLQRGRSYARGGQVLSIEEQKDGVIARVQGSQSKPYKITIKLKALSDAQWEAVINALAERAIFTAQLLAGEMPQEIEQAFAAAKVSLFPDRTADLTTSCSCPDSANPCKHVAATHYILGEQLDEDPFLLFRLRGRNQQQIMDALRQRRSVETENQQPGKSGKLVLAEERVAYTTEAPATPLDQNLDRFWNLAQPLTHFQLNIKAAQTPRPILKRLGQPNFLDESIEAYLAAAYEAATKAALEVAAE